MRPPLKISLLILMLCLTMHTAAAQAAAPAKPSPEPKYDKTAEVVIKGVVDEVISTPGEKSPEVHLMVKSQGELFEICLCPGKFLKEMDVDFAKGDQLQITGAKVKRDDKTVILAREIVKGNNTLTLRDKNGGPVWTWLVKD